MEKIFWKEQIFGSQCLKAQWFLIFFDQILFLDLNNFHDFLQHYSHISSNLRQRQTLQLRTQISNGLESVIPFLSTSSSSQALLLAQLCRNKRCWDKKREGLMMTQVGGWRAMATIKPWMSVSLGQCWKQRWKQG